MNSKVKKVLSVFLAALLFAGCAGGAAYGAVYGATAVPTVYVIGYGTAIYNAEGEQIMPVNEPEGYLSQALDACIRPFAKALISGDEADLSAYQDLLCEWIAPLYEEAKLDKNGEPQPGQYMNFSLSRGSENRVSGGKYPIRAYEFVYDYRLDPFYNAALLKQYVDLIKNATGFTKVNMVGRCEGSTIVMAYLAEYGHADINNLFFNTASNNGVLLASQLFSNHFSIDAYSVSLWLRDTSGSDMEVPTGEIVDFVKAVMDMSAGTYGLDMTDKILIPAYKKMLEGVLPRILLASYGTMPGIWAMVADRDFDRAVSYVFAGHEEEYAVLIAKLRNYNENVSKKTAELLNACKADGINIGIVAKYGYPSMPLFEETMLLSDGFTTVRDASFGATTANVNTTLTDAYISSHDAKYISPDKKIDASTCLFPDSTWFIGNLAHPNFPDWIDNFAATFLDADNMTVFTDANYPQYMVYVDASDTVIPVTEENKDDTVAVDTEPDFGSGFSVFYAKVSAFLAKIVAFVKGIIEGIIRHGKGIA